MYTFISQTFPMAEAFGYYITLLAHVLVDPDFLEHCHRPPLQSHHSSSHSQGGVSQGSVGKKSKKERRVELMQIGKSMLQYMHSVHYLLLGQVGTARTTPCFLNIRLYCCILHIVYCMLFHLRLLICTVLFIHLFCMPIYTINAAGNYLSATRQIENLICTNRESLIGSGAWNKEFYAELQSRPFYSSVPTMMCPESRSFGTYSDYHLYCTCFTTCVVDKFSPLTYFGSYCMLHAPNNVNYEEHIVFACLVPF